MLTQQIINGIVLGGVYALIALGYTMIYGVLFFINFAHGDVYMVGAFVGLWAATSGHFGLFGSIIAGMLTAAILGLIVERFAYRPLRKAPRLSPLLSALGVSMFLENLFIKIQGPQYRPFPNTVAAVHDINIGSLSITTLQLEILIISIALMIILTIFVQKTRMGKAIRATSENRIAASLMGVNTDQTIALVFFIGSALAGAARVLVGVYFNAVFPLMGWNPGMKGFIAAVLGGIGSIPGAMVGGLILGISEVLTVAYISPQWRDAVSFVILLIILFWRPWGLFGIPDKTNV